MPFVLCRITRAKGYQMKSRSELILLPTFEERFKYLSIGGKVGAATVGKNRYLNQVLYNSMEWRNFRLKIIARDEGCDLAHPDYQISDHSKILIHHINPLTVEDVLNRDPKIFDPENVITTVFSTHQAIHYGDDRFLKARQLVVRQPNDTCLWRRK